MFVICVDESKKNLEHIVLQAVKIVFPSLDDESELEGRNLLLKQVIVQLVAKLLDNDKKDLPFAILDLERKMEQRMLITDLANPKEVILNGYIDRVDIVEGDVVRILDYKTGDVKMRNVTIPELFTSAENKIAFQAYFYAYLYWKENPGKKIKLGIYPIQKLNDGIKYINNGEPISEDIFLEFEHHLKKLLQEIFTKGVAFYQVEDEANCLYCPYIGMCNR